jgi:adenine-specific DNA-methyltransferase
LFEDGRIVFGKTGEASPQLKVFYEEKKRFGEVQNTWFDGATFGTATSGTKELQDLFGGSALFPSPKPVSLLRGLLQLSAKSGDIVMDFFAGSCSTAHAVLEESSTDDGPRHFIMVQIPERLGQAADLDGSRIETIADIGMERIHRVIDRLKQGGGGQLDLAEQSEMDLGFRVFRLQESNLRPWPKDVPAEVDEVPERLQEQMDPLREGWSEEAVIAEVAVKEGFGLNYRLQELEGIEGNTIHRVEDPGKRQALYICLDEKLQDETWQGLSLEEEDLFICRDVALSDTQAANLALQCRFHTI